MECDPPIVELDYQGNPVVSPLNEKPFPMLKRVPLSWEGNNIDPEPPHRRRKEKD